MAGSPGGIEVGRISVRVVPDTSHLGTDLQVALDRIEARTDLKISTSIDTSKLDEQARLAVDQAQLAAGDLKIKTQVDSSQLREGETAAKGFSSGLSGIASAAIVLGPALIPLVGVLGGLAAVLAAPAVLGGAGLTLFGFITGAAIKQTEAQNKKLIQLKAAVDAAKQSLSNATSSASTSAANSLSSAQASAAASLKSAQNALTNAKTTAQVSSAAARIQAARASLSARTSAIQSSQSASVAAAQRKVAEATLAYQAALKGMTPAQLAFIRAQDGLKAAFHNLLAAVGGSVLGPVTTALKLLTSVMPKIEPILKSFAGVFDGFLTSASDATKSKGFSDLVHLIATQGAQAFKTFAQIVGNVFLAFGRLGGALLPFGQSVLTGLGKAAKGFADFAKSAKAKTEIKNLLDYIKSVGPKVGQTLGDIAGAAGHLVRAFAPIGTVVLTAVDGLAKAIKKIPIGLLTTLATALVGIVAASKLIGPLSAVFELLTSPIGLAVVAAVALGVGFVALYQHSKPLRNVLSDLGNFFKTQLLPVIKNAAEQILPQLNKAFHDISKTIHDNKGFLETYGKLLLVLGAGVVLAGIGAVIVAIRGIGLAFKFGIPLFHAWADLLLIVVGVGVKAFGLLEKAIIKSLGAVIDTAANAFGWIPGIGPKIKAAQAAFHKSADKMAGDITGVSAAIKRMRDKIDGTPKTAGPAIDATGKHVDALRQHLGSASAQLDLVGPRGKIAFDQVRGSVKSLSAAIEALPQPKAFKITVEDHATLALKALQAFRLKDKTLTVNLVERAPGVGGGIGIPGKNSAGQLTQPRSVQPPDLSSPNSPRAAQTGPGALVSIENAYLSDANAVLRHASKAHRARGGGGVMLPPPRTVGGFS
jgi:hypothetical protein